MWVYESTGYIGKSTSMEIEFAKHRNIPIFYFNGETLSGETTIEPSNELIGCFY